MAYPFDLIVALGSTQTGLTLTASVRDTAGSALGSQPAYTIVEQGGGWYSYHTSAMPDGQRGVVRILSGAAVMAVGVVTPVETENADVKTSTRGTSTYAGGAVASVTGDVGGNVVGSVGSVTAGVTVTTNNDKTGYTASTVTDKTGYSLTQAFPSNFAALAINASGHVSRVTLVDTTTTNTDMRGTDAAALAATALSTVQWTTARAALLDNLDAAVSTRATPAQVNAEADTALADVGLTTTVTGRIDAAITTRAAASTALTNATWTDAKAAFLDAAISSVSTGGVSAEDIATAVRSELATELARIDVAVSTRSTYAGADTSGTTTLLGRLTAPRAALLDNLDAAVSTRASASTALSTAVWTNTKAAFLDAAVSTAGGGTVQLDLAQTGLTPRALDSVADSALTVGDALVAALAGAAGKESVASTAYVVKTPSTGTVIRTFALTLDGDGLPVARN